MLIAFDFAVVELQVSVVDTDESWEDVLVTLDNERERQETILQDHLPTLYKDDRVHFSIHWILVDQFILRIRVEQCSSVAPHVLVLLNIVIVVVVARQTEVHVMLSEDVL